MRDEQRAEALAQVVPQRHVAVAASATTGDAVQAARADDAALIIVLHDGGILAAAVAVDTAAKAPPSTAVLAAADLDPPAARPDVTGEALAERVRDEGLPWVALTTAEGRFLGVIDSGALLELARRDRLP